MKKLIRVLAVFGVLSASGCDYWLTHPSFYNTIVVTVVSQSGAPVPSVPLTLYTAQRAMGYGTSDGTGRFVFTRVPAGNYGILANRPDYYRDYIIGNDSVTSVHDAIFVEPPSHDSVTFVFQRCSATVNVTALDDASAPVPKTGVQLYTSTEQLAAATTDASGRATFGDEALCVISIGLRIVPPPGYSVAPGRGTQIMDGFSLTDHDTLNLTFREQKTR